MPSLSIKNSGYFLYVVAACYLLTAYFSNGYHHFDEHYQILEFANYKLGLTDRSQLAWEFEMRIRPCIQPTLALGIFKFLSLLGMNDAFTWAFVLRLVSGAFSVYVLYKLINSLLPDVPVELKPYFTLFSYLLWFLPYLNVRFSSENWSGMFFALCIVALRAQDQQKLWLKYLSIGLLMGVSIMFRFQAAILVAGSLAWLIFIKKPPFKFIFLAFAGLLFVLSLSILIDSWFYEEWVITPVNYFNENILNGKASSFGTAPWYSYFTQTISAALFPFGILIIIFLGIFLYKYPKSVLTWCIVPFLVIHLIIPHKELRFLFPLASFIPYIFFASCGPFLIYMRPKPIAALAAGCLLLINFAAYVCVSVKGAGDGKLALSAYINHNYGSKPVTLICYPKSDPYNDLIDVTDVFYTTPGLFIIHKQAVKAPVFDTLADQKRITLLAINHQHANTPAVKVALAHPNLLKITESIPWISKLGLLFYDKAMLDENIELYQISKTNN